MDVRQRMEELIRTTGDGQLAIAGHEVRAEPAPDWEQRLRSSLTRRFFERRPNATEQTWHHFRRQIDDYARKLDEVDDQTERELILMVDGL